MIVEVVDKIRQLIKQELSPEQVVEYLKKK